MTIDAGVKPEGAPERSPIAGAGAPSGVDAGLTLHEIVRLLFSFFNELQLQGI